jgi:hypothetical protein
MKPVDEPDAGDPHVRFDERGWETELPYDLWSSAVTAPILDSPGPFFHLGCERRRP